MPTSTYTLIQEQVLGSAAASVTFSSIPGTYKDLVLECVPIASLTTYISARVNGDTGTNYSNTQIIGNGSSATSSRSSSTTSIGSQRTDNGGSPTTVRFDFMSYANTNVNKTVLKRHDNAGVETIAQVALWRSTSAITSVNVFTDSANNWAIGSTFRLWGVAG